MHHFLDKTQYFSVVSSFEYQIASLRFIRNGLKGIRKIICHEEWDTNRDDKSKEKEQEREREREREREDIGDEKEHWSDNAQNDWKTQQRDITNYWIL